MWMDHHMFDNVFVDPHGGLWKTSPGVDSTAFVVSSWPAGQSSCQHLRNATHPIFTRLDVLCDY
jgi:hypothetical protein